ncbi:hypothetical protein [Azospirillum canadense]|uniref:hypothetical protein n=1 Tax=Azospirillum canadense TaxID=403962 RepID=UPI00222628A8|nr:hypothetical protein [Azospirillum canadense]MCW2240718.1 hypothetical protein [Azospirillum canadense]
MNVLVTHHGTPLLVISSQAVPDAPPSPTPIAPPGTLALDAARGTLTLSVPPDLFPQAVASTAAAVAPVIAAPGFPPEVLAHLRTLPGVWCVATDPTGLVLAEWPACNPGQAPDAVLALLPAPAQQAALARLAASPTSPAVAAGPRASSYAIALADGIHSVASPHSWPPGAQHRAPSPVPPGIAAAHAALSPVAVLPYPPAGAFAGAVAAPLPPSPATSARLAAAIESLRAVVLNGQPVGAGLSGVLDWALSVHWSAPTAPPSRVTPDAGVYATFPAPPPCGWSPHARTLFLSPDLPPSLDVAYLAAGLYHAHVSLSGQSTVGRLAASLLHPATSLPELAAECSAAAAEAARAWILLVEVLRALPDPTVRAAALATFADLPYGHEALSRFPLPPTPDPAAYTIALNGAIARAATDLVPLLTPTITALHREAAAVRAAWHDPARRASFPRAARSIGPFAPVLPGADATKETAHVALPSAGPTTRRGPSVASPSLTPPVPDARPPQPYVAAGVVALPPEDLPSIGYMAPAPAAHPGPLLVFRPPAAPTGAVMIDRDDGVRVIVSDIPAATLSSLSAAGKATIMVYDLDGLSLTEPQLVSVAPYDDLR